MYKQKYQFDKNNKERIYNLLVVKDKVLRKGYEWACKSGASELSLYDNFYTAISDQIDMLLCYFINDEISASLENRGPIQILIDELIGENHKVPSKVPDIALNDLNCLFGNRTDFIIGSAFFDFNVSVFSVFEKHVVDIYDILISKHPRNDGKDKKLIRLIEKYAHANDEQKGICITKIKKISFYTSGSEKIDYVLSRLKCNKGKIEHMRKCIHFYRKKRNTIHNLGIHHGESEFHTVGDIDIMLNSNAPSCTKDYNSYIFACDELIDVYEIICNDIFK